MHTNDLINILIILFLVLFVGITIIATHDEPIVDKNFKNNRLNYVINTDSNMSGIKKIQIANNICDESFGYNGKAYKNMWLPLLHKVDIDYCVNRLIEN